MDSKVRFIENWQVNLEPIRRYEIVEWNWNSVYRKINIFNFVLRNTYKAHVYAIEIGSVSLSDNCSKFG